MSEKLKNLKGYALPILVGLVTIISGINEKRAQDRNEALEQKLDELNEKLNNREED